MPVVATTQDWTHHRLGYRKAFFGFDELHGFNRDSRSRRANRSNADALAYAINRLQASLRRNDPAARALVWGDMLNPWHNGARPQYQQWSGGVEGSSWRASQQLDKSVIHVPWVYNADPQADSPAVDCHTANVGKGCIDPGVQCNNAMCEINNTVSFCASAGLSASPASKPVSAGVSRVTRALCRRRPQCC